ncbi:uncharacterized protein LOC115313150 [Ixodes scapularis]|uniref:uncharacterized protein LOC115313150 n=1 Tax=Ixodes scapularis TaxID=6945 RepID=UPI001A9FE825|nr:uncharacterized protein LOC115313150 [Ixodes scapularis]
MPPLCMDTVKKNVMWKLEDNINQEGVSLESLPHQLRICGGNVLVVVPGHEPICLRCHRAGHIRRDCRVPRCNQCQAFGHEASSCVKTYARVPGNNIAVASDDTECIDVFEAERAATATTPTDQQTQGEPAENGGVCDEAKPRPSPGASKDKAAPEVVEELGSEKVTDFPDVPAATAVPGNDDGKNRVDEGVGTKVYDEVKVKGDDGGKSEEGEGGVDGRLRDAETGAARRRHEGVSSKVADRELRRLEREWVGNGGLNRERSRSRQRREEQLSGTEEQYTEKEQLLQEVADLAHEFGYKVKSVPRKTTATEEGANTTSTSTLEPPERATATTARPAKNRAARDAVTTA